MIIHRNLKFRLRGTAVAIGKFDGVHRGHDRVLKELAADHLQKVIFTFNAEKGTPLENSGKISSEEEKISLLAGYGPDHIIIYNFGKREAALSPKRFVRQILCRRLGMKRIYAGTDFRFGRGGKGDIELLKKLGKKYGFEVIVINKLQYEGEDISSTRIRSELTAGRQKRAEEMLGHEIPVH